MTAIEIVAASRQEVGGRSAKNSRLFRPRAITNAIANMTPNWIRAPIEDSQR